MEELETFTFSKDVRLPVQLQRAMAAEAEAAREARAKVWEANYLCVKIKTSNVGYCCRGGTKGLKVFE